MNAPKKLLIVTFSPVPGCDRHTARLTATVRALRRFFESIDIIAIRGDHISHVERFHHARLLRVPLVGDTPTAQLESFRRAVRRQIESESYDVVQSGSPVDGLAVMELRHDKGYAVVHDACSFAVEDTMVGQDQRRQWALLAEQLFVEDLQCAQAADFVIAPSLAARIYLKEHGVERPIMVVPTSVNIDVFDWELAPNPPTPQVLCLGGLAPWTDVDCVLEAVVAVRELLPVQLRWVGEASAKRRENAMTYAEQRGLQDVVLFEPPVDRNDFASLISAASIGLAPAAAVPRFLELGDQPFGLLECMACRRPLVAPRIPGVEEILREGTDALLYTPGDAAGLASALLFLLQNVRHRRLLAQRGYRRIRESFSESSQRRNIVRAYQKLAGPPAELVARKTDVPGPCFSAEGALRPEPQADFVTAVYRNDEHFGAAFDGDSTGSISSVFEVPSFDEPQQAPPPLEESGSSPGGALVPWPSLGTKPVAAAMAGPVNEADVSVARPLVLRDVPVDLDDGDDGILDDDGEITSRIPALNLSSSGDAAPNPDHPQSHKPDDEA